MSRKLKNFINGKWVDCTEGVFLDVINPASGKVISKVPAGSAKDVELAASSAHKSFSSWRNTPAGDRVQYLFKMKKILEDNSDEIATLCTNESGKTFAESKAEIVRAIENVEVACGIPVLMQSEFSEDIASGIDEFMIRQPLGTGACIVPFNFPVMITFWFMPYALATGNTYIVKPSEKVPQTMTRIFELFEELNLPQGVLNLVHGGKPAVDAILEHSQIHAVSFVGSSEVAKYIYTRGTAHGKRVQAQGGAKNPVLIMPDADLDSTVKILADSAFGCAGQRCLAASLVVMTRETAELFLPKLIAAAAAKKCGYGMEEGVGVGAIITNDSKERILKLIDEGVEEGASLLLDGRNERLPDNTNGFFIAPTILDDIKPGGIIHQTEVFGPVLGILYADNLDHAIELINNAEYGNSASIFTRSGSAARRFRHDVLAGNIGVNIGVAAPMAYFPFSGWKKSFYGDLHAQSRHAVEFYTQTKVVIERWHDQWSRKF